MFTCASCPTTHMTRLIAYAKRSLVMLLRLLDLSIEAVIVFDAADNSESAGKTEKISGVRIMFSPFGSSADKVIEKLAHDAREKRIETLVVTSDATIQDTVFGGGVDRMSANGFSLEMDSLSEEAALDKEVTVKRKATVQDRIDKDTLAKLKALRDRM